MRARQFINVQPRGNAAQGTDRCYAALETHPGARALYSIIRQFLAPALVACVLGACATTPGSGFRYNEVVIVNRSYAPVTDVTVTATDSGRLFACGNIAPRGICSNRFTPRDYHVSPIEVTWSVGNGRRRSETLEIEVPRDFVAQLPMRGVLVIDNSGRIEAFLQQDVPGPHL